jgi:hypothetical protein
VGKKYLQAGSLNHGPKGCDGGSPIVLLQDDHPIFGQMAAYRLEEVFVDSPIRIARAYVALILIDEMRWVAYDQVPHFRTRNALEIIRLINSNAVVEFVDVHGVLARQNRRRVDVGKAERFTEAMPEH